MTDRAAELIRALALRPHPEGGHFREVYRSLSSVTPDDGRSSRQAMTTIYFLLSGGEHSRWHRVMSDEAWHWYGGDSLELLVAPPTMERVSRYVLGSAENAHDPASVVPAGWWQAARPLGRFALSGCTVAPGFEYEDFSFLRDASELADRLIRLEPGLAALM